MAPSSSVVLDVRDVQYSYGAIRALRGVSLEVHQGETVALIGANGGGKSTLLSVVTGLRRAESGEIRFNGQPITNLATHGIARLGVTMVPEGRGILHTLTVQENLALGVYLRSDREGIARDLENVLQRFPILAERKSQLAGTLSGGQQQMLALARAIASRPRLLMLDEPSLGLAPVVVAEVFQVLQQLREEGMTIVLAEQNARLALRYSDRGYVLETGAIVLAGDSKELLESDLVKQAYLGVAPV